MEAEPFQFAPLFPEWGTVVPAICVAVRRRVDPASGWFLPLFDLPDALVYLGALLDGRQKVIEWLEVWVQVAPRSRGAGTEGAALNNQYLNQKWRERCELLDQLHPQSAIAGPWQHTHAQPLAFNPQKVELAPISPPGATRVGGWRLCEDDRVLQSADLKGYSESSGRYLYIQEMGLDSPLIALQRETAASSRMVLAQPAQGFKDEWPVFNREGGCYFIRRFSPLLISHFKRVLDGYGQQGIGSGAYRPHLSEAYSLFENQAYVFMNHGLIFAGKSGRSGRLLECFLLKLLLFREVVAVVAGVTAQEKKPFLNLRPEDFRVSLDQTSGRLPALWSFRLSLARTTEALAVNVLESGRSLFKPLAPIEAGAYVARELATVRKGRCSVRIREVTPVEKGAIVLHGTLAGLTEKILDSGDLVEINLLLADGSLPFIVQPLPAQTLATTEIRFESLPIKHSTDIGGALLSLKGIDNDAGYQVTPCVSSPGDLYALAVIGLEILIDTRKISLPVALDECLSLAALVGGSVDAGRTLDLATRRSQIIKNEPRFLKFLGPVNLCKEAAEASEFQSVPAELWWRFIDVLLTMFPGRGPDSIARNLGDVNPHALESCYLDVLAPLEGLVEDTRGMLFGDVAANREVQNLLAEFE